MQNFRFWYYKTTLLAAVKGGYVCINVCVCLYVNVYKQFYKYIEKNKP